MPTSGLYRARHPGHVLPNDLILLEGFQFPRCARCNNPVEFELLNPEPHLNEENAPVIHVLGVFAPHAA